MMENIKEGMLVTDKSVVGSAVYVVIRIDNAGFALVQSKSTGNACFIPLDELQQATLEQYRLYGYDFFTANGKTELTPYELTNFVIWLKGEKLQSGINALDVSDLQVYELASKYIAFKNSK